MIQAQQVCSNLIEEAAPESVLQAFRGKAGGREHGHETPCRAIPFNVDPLPVALSYYERAQALDRRGDFAQAFEWASRGSELLLTHPRMDHRTGELILRKLASCPPARATNPPGKASQSSFSDNRTSPVFLIGFPCSGEGLLQRLLGGYPGIHVCHNDSALAQVQQALEEWTPEENGRTTDRIAQLTSDQIQHLRDIYWQQLSQSWQGADNPDWVVDCNQLNLLYLPLINALFPQARLIMLQRDPRDICLNVFLRPLPPDQTTALPVQWESIAVFYRAAHQYQCRIQAVLDCRWMEVKYESLLATPLETMAAILRFMGISWITAYRIYPDFTGTVKEYCRNQISTWNNYHRFFDPVQTLLSAAIQTMGYA